MRDKNVIVIARQLNTIVNADQILVLQDGNLSERGTHCELFKCGGWYARVIAEQAKTERMENTAKPKLIAAEQRTKTEQKRRIQEEMFPVSGVFLNQQLRYPYSSGKERDTDKQ